MASETDVHDVNDFDSIADVYEELVSWAPYGKWVDDLEVRLLRHGLPAGGWIFDAACGTGLSLLPWLRKGYQAAGADASEPMLRLAHERLRLEGLGADLVRQDLRRLELGRTFDAAVCMHSGLDYILEPGGLAEAFRCLRGCLRAGGLLAFDKCLDEPAFYRADYTDRRRLSCGTAEFHYHWDRARKVLEQRCILLRTDGSRPARSEFCFRLLAIRPDQLVAMVERAGFECVERPYHFRVADPGMGIFRAV